MATVVFFKGKGLISWVIRTYTRSRFSHVGVLWTVEGTELVIEAQLYKGVSCHALQNRLLDSPTFLTVPYPLNLTLALSQLGDWYSIKDAILSTSKPASHAGYFCGELVADLLGLGRHTQGWTPQRLFETLTNKNLP